MNTQEATILSTTESLCPTCLKRLPAVRVAIGSCVYLDKTCPEHGFFRTIIWRGDPVYQSWSVDKPLSTAPQCATGVDKGCPYDCGLCPDHLQHTCCVLVEVTQRCNLSCPICFASAGQQKTDPDLQTIEQWYRMLMQSGGPYNIQLSGGEPTVRDDLPDIIRLGRSMGFTFFQLNTNGLRLAEDAAYVRGLKRAGLDCVFLQFDGVTDSVFETIRGRALLETKKAAIARCAQQQLGVVLVPTLVPGVNTSEIGGMIEFAAGHMPVVRGIHFQPVSYFGRYPRKPADEDRITSPEVLTAIEQQTAGKMRKADFQPPSAEIAYCSFNGNFILMENGEWRAWKNPESSGCCQPKSDGSAAKKAQAFVAKRWSAPRTGEKKETAAAACCINTDSLDKFLERAENYMLSISGMAFQDVWNVDLDRLRECFIHVVSPDARIIPFCAYNLTDQEGRSLYRPCGNLHDDRKR